jgi:hypothetical protein
MPKVPLLICLAAVVANLLSWMHGLSWDAQPPFFYTPKFTSLTALRWTMVGVAAIPPILYALGLLPPAFFGLTLNILFSVIFLGVTTLCCYSLWRRHTQKT